MEFSLRYPPVTGRLYTRYAPVRRSSAAYCYALLPLDLHVLSLPLAFILSQDQTLHCKNCFFFTFDSQCLSRHPTMTESLTHAISCFNLFNVLALPFSTTPFRRRKRVQRYNHFPNYQKKFSPENTARRRNTWFATTWNKKKISKKSQRSPKTARKKSGKHADKRKIGTNKRKTAQKQNYWLKYKMLGHKNTPKTGI